MEKLTSRQELWQRNLVVRHVLVSLCTQSAICVLIVVAKKKDVFVHEFCTQMFL